MTKCNQSKCIFNQLGFGCRRCQLCNAEEYNINDNCDRCWNCQGDEGILRWDDNEEVEETQAELKPIEVKT